MGKWAKGFIHEGYEAKRSISPCAVIPVVKNSFLVQGFGFVQRRGRSMLRPCIGVNLRASAVPMILFFFVLSGTSVPSVAGNYMRIL